MSIRINCMFSVFTLKNTLATLFPALKQISRVVRKALTRMYGISPNMEGYDRLFRFCSVLPSAVQCVVALLVLCLHVDLMHALCTSTFFAYALGRGEGGRQKACALYAREIVENVERPLT